SFLLLRHHPHVIVIVAAAATTTLGLVVPNAALFPRPRLPPSSSPSASDVLAVALPRPRRHPRACRSHTLNREEDEKAGLEARVCSTDTSSLS
ncbi:hypothetical protein DFH11DRAFT_1652375, partial [Phellopilus nigrolimitatus]